MIQAGSQVNTGKGDGEPSLSKPFQETDNRLLAEAGSLLVLRLGQNL
jgi:hypothetical protein